MSSSTEVDIEQMVSLSMADTVGGVLPSSSRSGNSKNSSRQSMKEKVEAILAHSPSSTVWSSGIINFIFQATANSISTYNKENLRCAKISIDDGISNAGVPPTLPSTSGSSIDAKGKVGEKISSEEGIRNLTNSLFSIEGLSRLQIQYQVHCCVLLSISFIIRHRHYNLPALPP